MLNIKLLDEVELENVESGFCRNLIIPLQISLGEITMPISTILKLVGSEVIEVPLPEYTQVTLLLGGEPVATAEMEIVDEKIELKIKEIFLDHGLQNNDIHKVELDV